MTQNWFEFDSVDEIDSPTYLVYPDRVENNIHAMIRMAGGPQRLRPHVKTYKMVEIVKMQLVAGINKFKCATIAEAEMLCNAGAKDILLAYQPVGPKIDRLLKLTAMFPDVRFATLVDNEFSANQISKKSLNTGNLLDLYIDLDTGNHRTGIDPDLAVELYSQCKNLSGVKVVGLHAYDGHVRHSDFGERKEVSDQAFVGAETVWEKIFQTDDISLEIVAGGSPTFPCHAQREEHVICSPGTCLLWDWGYDSILPDLNFDFAALVLTRVISKVGTNRICLDLGHKAIASENPFPRVHFLNLDTFPQVGHSEEHLVLDVGDNSGFKIGQVLYGVPIHVCPTTALYSQANVIKGNQKVDNWEIIARNRSLTI